MAKLHIDGDDLVVEVEGMDKLWALRSRLTIPLAHVRGATVDPGITADGAGLRAGGSRVPGVLTAGTFRKDGQHVFWDVHDPRRAVVIELRDETYARLVIDVDDPRSAVTTVQESISDDQRPRASVDPADTP